MLRQIRKLALSQKKFKIILKQYKTANKFSALFPKIFLRRETKNIEKLFFPFHLRFSALVSK